MSLQAVAFDLDATLVGTERDRETLLAEAVERSGVSEVSREAYLRAHDADLATETRAPIFETVLGEGETTPVDVQASARRVAEAYREVVEDALVPVDGAESLLERLRSDYRTGLLTDGPVRAQRGKLTTLGWGNLFDAVVVTGALAAGKPDRRAFDALVDHLDVPAARVAYVGDHPEFDVDGAAAAGLRPVQVLVDGRERHPDAEAYVERDRLGSDLPDVLDCLG